MLDDRQAYAFAMAAGTQRRGPQLGVGQVRLRLGRLASVLKLFELLEHRRGRVAVSGDTGALDGQYPTPLSPVRVFRPDHQDAAFLRAVQCLGNQSAGDLADFFLIAFYFEGNRPARTQVQAALTGARLELCALLLQQ